ncbi:MAG TPA: hypothetical protein VKZ41_12125 [Gemmatimonadales bacterium]|nr:hypothetical protein [Gemmatimonadales bacterium]
MHQHSSLSNVHPLDAAAHAYALLGRIGELENAEPAGGSPWEYVRALEEQEHQLAELSYLLSELEVVRREMATSDGPGVSSAAYKVLVEVLAPVEVAARRLLANAPELAERRRALSASLKAV